jgi:glycosyltransferase involved in cell wall biosynthesis
VCSSDLFVPNNLAWMGHYTKELQRMGVECLYSPFVNSINQVIQQRGNEFDLVYITRYYVAQQYVDQIRKHAPQAKIVMNNADLHFLRELRAGIQAKDKQAIVLSVETREKELAVMNKVDLVLSYTDVEKAVIQSHNLDLTLVAKCPWVVETVPKVPRFEERCDIAFLGGYNHHPNAEAVEWFVEQVMPLLRQQLPQVVFKVYGSHVPKRLHELAEKHENISIAGWVPTVDAVYNTCRVFVAPLQSGAGIKGKVIGALAHGVPCVLSQLAAEGIPVADGVDACVADKPEEWVAAIVGLYQNQTQWQAMSVKALGFAERLYGFDKGVAQMQEALQQVDLVTSTEHQTLVAR